MDLSGSCCFDNSNRWLFYPVNNSQYTAIQLDELCSAGWSQLALFFGNQDFVKGCQNMKIITFGIYGAGIIGIILVIVGALYPKNKESDVCPYCNFVAMSENELLDHKAKNHLDKSRYKCEHCDFIGITNEILWNHYNDKHPDKKKWEGNN